MATEYCPACYGARRYCRKCKTSHCQCSFRRCKAKTQAYYLDPDFRRDAPDDAPYCVRCQKPITDVSKAVRVTVDWETWMVTEGGEELMGKDCWQAVSAG